MNPTNTSQNPSTPTGAAEPGSSGGGIAGAKQHIKESAREAVNQVKAAAASTMARAKEESGRIVGDKKNTAADRIGGYSSAIHDSAKSLEEKDPNIAWFTHRAADRLQRVADYVRERDFTQLRSDASEVARRHPAVFFGGLFVAGLLVGNLLKASNRATNGASSGESYGTGDGGTANRPGSEVYGQSQGFGDTEASGKRGTGIENEVTT